MTIRQAKISDIDNIMRMYKSCVNGMIEDNSKYNYWNIRKSNN